MIIRNIEGLFDERGFKNRVSDENSLGLILWYIILLTYSLLLEQIGLSKRVMFIYFPLTLTPPRDTGNGCSREWRSIDRKRETRTKTG